MKLISSSAAVLFVLCACVTALAEDPIRVYTNADIEALEPVPETKTIRDDEFLDTDWEPVLAFIDREHARLDAERRYRLERQVTDAELDVLANPAPSYGLALAPYNFYGYGYHRGGRSGHRSGRERGPELYGAGGLRPIQPAGLIKPLYARPGGTIRPLHARPNVPYRGRSIVGSRGGASRGGGSRPSGATGGSIRGRGLRR